MEPITLTIILASASVLTSFIACTRSILAFRKQNTTNASQSENTIDLTIKDKCGDISHEMAIRCEVDDLNTSSKKVFTNVEKNEVVTKIADISSQFANITNSVNDNTNPILATINNLQSNQNNADSNVLQVQDRTSSSSSTDKENTTLQIAPTYTVDNNTTVKAGNTTLDSIMQSLRYISLDWYRFATLQNVDLDAQEQMQWLPLTTTITQNSSEIIIQNNSNTDATQLISDKMESTPHFTENDIQELQPLNNNIDDHIEELYSISKNTNNPSPIITQSNTFSIVAPPILPISLNKTKNNAIKSNNSLNEVSDYDDERINEKGAVIQNHTIDNNQLPSQNTIINTTNVDLSGVDHNNDNVD